MATTTKQFNAQTATLTEINRELKRLSSVKCRTSERAAKPDPAKHAAAIAEYARIDDIKQERVGKNGRRFKIFKFRSMVVDAEARKKELEEQNKVSGGFMFKIEDDPRITRIGRFIRKTSIDELPQLFNVLFGTMSLVGTRPPTVDEVEKYDTKHWRRLSIKPGITGMWQTSGRSEITDFEEVVALDTYYIDNWSIWLDMKIIIKTAVQLVLKRTGAY